MPGIERITTPTLDILEALLRAQADGTELHGWSIAKAVRRPGPTVYGVIDRLEEAGWVTGRWEDQVRPGKPPRRFFRLTGIGTAEAKALFTEHRPAALVAGSASGGDG